MRDDFPEKLKETLAKRVGMLCSNPNCQKATAGPREDASKALNIGVAAHITAASPDGPRYGESLSESQRSSIENGIWLCQNCAKLVDNDEARYTVGLLKGWKRDAEKAALRRVETNDGGTESRAVIRALIIVISGLIVCGALLWWKYNDSSKSDPSRPYLEPTLVIDSISVSNVLYHYEVHNTGGKSAYNIRFGEYGEGVSLKEGPALTANAPITELAPGQTQRISIPLPRLEIPSYALRKTLVLSYQDDAYAISNLLCKEFRFFGQRELLRPGPLHFESSLNCRELALPSANEISGAMSLNKASVWISFAETNAGGVPLKAFIQSTNRFLDIDVPNRKITFWSINTDGKMIKLSKKLEQVGGLHSLVVSWSEDGAMLSLDLQTISDPTNFSNP